MYNLTSSQIRANSSDLVGGVRLVQFLAHQYAALSFKHYSMYSEVLEDLRKLGRTNRPGVIESV